MDTPLYSSKNNDKPSSGHQNWSVNSIQHNTTNSYQFVSKFDASKSTIPLTSSKLKQNTSIGELHTMQIIADGVCYPDNAVKKIVYKIRVYYKVKHRQSCKFLTVGTATSPNAVKTRVAPIKTITIPKLELCGAALLTKLFQKCKNALHTNDIECYAWSDSTIALAWICNNSTKLPSFVEHRVSEIRKSKLDWRYVPTHSNPADCASRGITPSQLSDHNLWWHGPQFLLENKEKWPENNCFRTATRTSDIQIFSTCTPAIDLWPLKKYSTYSKLQR